MAKLKLFGAFVVASSPDVAEEMFADGAPSAAFDVTDLAGMLFGVGGVEGSKIPPSGSPKEATGVPPTSQGDMKNTETYRLFDGTEVIDAQQMLNDLQIDRDAARDEVAQLVGDHQIMAAERDSLKQQLGLAQQELRETNVRFQAMAEEKTRFEERLSAPADALDEQNITLRLKADLTEARAEIAKVLGELAAAKEIIKLNEEEAERAEKQASDAQARVAWEASQKTLSEERRKRFAEPVAIDAEVDVRKIPPSGSPKEATGVPPTRQGDMKAGELGLGGVKPSLWTDKAYDDLLRREYATGVMNEVLAKLNRLKPRSAPDFTIEQMQRRAFKLGLKRLKGRLPGDRRLEEESKIPPSGSREEARPVSSGQSQGDMKQGSQTPAGETILGGQGDVKGAGSRTGSRPVDPAPPPIAGAGQDASEPRSRLYMQHGARCRELMAEAYGAEDIAETITKELPRPQVFSLAQAIKLMLEIKRIDAGKETGKVA